MAVKPDPMEDTVITALGAPADPTEQYESVEATWDAEAEEALMNLEKTKPMAVNDSPTADELTRKYLVEMGVVLGDPSDEDVAQMYVLLRAMRTYSVKDQTHRGLWRYFGSLDSAHQARAKATRVYNIAIQLLRDPEEVINNAAKDPMDDAIDLINYAAFFIRNASEGNYG